MPERFLLQILRNLVTHGILRSSRGVDGGYTLIKAPDEVSLLDIIEAIEGPMGEPEALGDGFSEQAGMRLSAALSEVTDTARRQLEAITFSHLLKAPESPIKDSDSGSNESPPEESNDASDGDTPGNASGGLSQPN